MRTKISLAKIKKESKVIRNIVENTRKKLFQLEVLQSQWESDHGLGKVYKSAEEFMAAINKKTAVYL